TFHSCESMTNEDAATNRIARVGNIAFFIVLNRFDLLVKIPNRSNLIFKLRPNKGFLRPNVKKLVLDRRFC
ncbi:MAG TPA: hypothetical protein VFV08_05330, partial [Puia sp.]|nr:hypothetical protein [Puia sp.]